MLLPTVVGPLDHNAGHPCRCDLRGQSQAKGQATWVRQSEVVGGAVYDALVGWVARCAELPLLTRDARALPTYRRLGIETLLIDPTLA